MPLPRLPSLDGLLAFDAVARLGSFEQAAELLNVGPSAIAKRIAALEALLGTPLLQRGGKVLTLTTAGKEYLGPAQQALALLSAMPQHQRLNQQRERLRITAPPTFARLMLVPALPDFEAQFPDVELELVLSTPFLDEAAPPAEVEIRHGVVGREIAPAQVLMHEQVTPLIAPSLAPLESPAALRQATLLRTPLEPWEPWLRAAGLDWPEPAQGTRYVDLGLVMEAALQGQGVVLGHPRLAADALRRGELLRPFELSVPAARQYGITHCAQTSAPAAAFAEWLRELMSAGG